MVNVRPEQGGEMTRRTCDQHDTWDRARDPWTCAHNISHNVIIHNVDVKTKTNVQEKSFKNVKNVAENVE